MRKNMKNFENYSQLAALLIVDLEAARPTQFYSPIADKDCLYSPRNAYQYASKRTTDDQDEANIVSQVIYINARSLDGIDIEMTEQFYQELLQKLIHEFDALGFGDYNGQEKFVRFN